VQDANRSLLYKGWKNRWAKERIAREWTQEAVTPNAFPELWDKGRNVFCDEWSSN